jgi:hypothetical protein
MQGAYQGDKPFCGRYQTFFAVTVSQVMNSQILRKCSKNWTLFLTLAAIAAGRFQAYL